MATRATDKQRITLFLHPAIAKHAKAQAILQDMSVTSLVEAALVQYLPKETVIKKIDPREYPDLRKQK